LDKSHRSSSRVAPWARKEKNVNTNKLSLYQVSSTSIMTCLRRNLIILSLTVLVMLSACSQQRIAPAPSYVSPSPTKSSTPLTQTSRQGKSIFSSDSSLGAWLKEKSSRLQPVASDSVSAIRSYLSSARSALESYLAK